VSRILGTASVADLWLPVVRFRDVSGWREGYCSFAYSALACFRMGMSLADAAYCGLSMLRCRFY